MHLLRELPYLTARTLVAFLVLASLTACGQSGSGPEQAADDAMEEAGEAAEEMNEAASRTMEEAADRAEEMGEAARRKAEEAGDAMEDAADEMTDDPN
ncbi:MAG: hypothetical protein V2J02_19025 [Pseudomonadales bacterium]|jgi:predicted small lipoprotein YifL|nr:hypothetical protein [Pseudomonadales bacterium]